MSPPRSDAQASEVPTPTLLLSLSIGGVDAIVYPNDGHPDQYLWIEFFKKRFFLGVRVAGMTRGDVRRMAEAFLRRHATA